jgi:hypothetical protein
VGNEACPHERCLDLIRGELRICMLPICARSHNEICVRIQYMDCSFTIFLKTIYMYYGNNICTKLYLEHNGV